MDILDQILAEDRAKAYSDRKGGYTRKYGPDISWNGDTTGRFVLDDHFVLVSETAIDLTKVESIMMKSQNDDSSLVVDAGELTVKVVDENTSTITPKNVNNIICASSIAKDYTADDDFGNVYDCKKGTYFYFDESIYISYVKMKETIVPIDPKFWAIETMETVFVHGAEFSERDAAILNAYASQKLPIFIRAKLQISDTYTMECAAVFTLLLAPDRTVYSAVASNARVDVIQYEDLNGGWVASLTTGT